MLSNGLQKCLGKAVASRKQTFHITSHIVNMACIRTKFFRETQAMHLATLTQFTYMIQVLHVRLLIPNDN